MEQEPDFLEGVVNNAVFRVVIWKDIQEEFFEHKPLFGFSFGKPLRSKRLEALIWASSEWSRDGWIAPHNSFIHIVYRLGIVGLIFIGYVSYLFLKMTMFFFKRSDWKGCLLSSIIFNWFIAANFLLILEMPYTAIMIWLIYGGTVAYYSQQLSKEIKN